MDLGLSQDEIALQARARAFSRQVARPRAAAVDRDEQYPWDIVKALAEAGFLGMTIPKALGGQGRSFLDAVLVIEEMAKSCTVTARIVVETNMGALSTVMAYGSDAQKTLAAELVLAGDKPAICITEPEAGSDALAMRTRADKRGDRYVINGKKHWITGAGVSRLHLIFARVFDERGEELGIGGFLAVRDEAKGLRVTKREQTMGLRGMPEGELTFDNLEVPASMAVLPPSGFARGFADLMNAYNSQRVGAGTVAMGVAAGALELALDWAKTREQFGRPIGEFQGLQWMLADMQTQLTASRLMLYQAARSRGPEGSAFPDPMVAAQAKIFASETAITIVNGALQLFGARGYSRELPLERMARDVRMFTIGGGTAQVLRTLVASKMLGWKLPQARDGYAPRRSLRDAAE
ncbi:MAG TPA: 3-sulfinopropanoyl-CoA desulfinase [Pseudolabrys sp.]|nr:3-sulfinopropanoyl-CoA desulfinase [Pseudolabrys sp.]